MLQLLLPRQLGHYSPCFAYVTCEGSRQRKFSTKEEGGQAQAMLVPMASQTILRILENAFLLATNEHLYAL